MSKIVQYFVVVVGGIITRNTS